MITTFLVEKWALERGLDKEYDDILQLSLL